MDAFTGEITPNFVSSFRVLPSSLWIDWGTLLGGLMTGSTSVLTSIWCAGQENYPNLQKHFYICGLHLTLNLNRFHQLILSIVTLGMLANPGLAFTSTITKFNFTEWHLSVLHASIIQPSELSL